MKWLLLLLGLAVACLGSAGAASLVATARRKLADAISRRLRGGAESLDWLPATERQVAAAMAATAFGVALVGAAIPGLFDTATLPVLAVLVVLLVVPATLMVAYLVPRWITLPRAEAVLEQLRPVLAGWGTLLSVVLPARDTDTTEDVRALARDGALSGVEGDELVMVGGVMSFATRPVREVMTPRTDVVAVAHDASYGDVVALFAESGYTRIPVYRTTLDEIIGMIHAFDLFKLQPHDPLPVRPVSFAPESRAAGDLLLEMQRDRRHFAVVVDEFGGTAGIVTLENLLEALVGEISDEEAAPTGVIAMPSELLELDGAASPELVQDHFHVALPSGAATIGGLLAEHAGRIPVSGDRFALAGLEIDVLQASPSRVERLLIRRAGRPAVDLDRTAR